MTQYLKHQKSYPSGRICESPGCSTILSIYNDDEICAKCEDDLSLEDKFPGVLERRMLRARKAS